MKKLCIVISLLFILSCMYSKPKLYWGEGPRFVTYMTLTGKTGFVTTPGAFCAPMGTLMLGVEQTFSTLSPIGVVANVHKLTFAPFNVFEFGYSKALAFLDEPSPTTYQNGTRNTGFYFDSTPFMFHAKVRLFAWGNENKAAVAMGQDFDVVPDDSGSSSRGYISTTVYFVMTGVTTLIGSFNFGFGKTFYFLHWPDFKFNFFASWVYSFAQLDHRLQLCFDVSNADYRAGAARFKVAGEDRAFINFQVRGVVVKTKRFQWTLMAAFYDVFDVGVGGFNASIGTTFNIDLY